MCYDTKMIKKQKTQSLDFTLSANHSRPVLETFAKKNIEKANLIIKRNASKI